MKSIEEIMKRVTKFRDERNWKQFHTPKDLAISISLEAAELLELFQWTGADTDAEEKKDRMKEELADVLLYSFLFADRMGFAVDEIMLEKLERNIEKYPVKESYGSSLKYDELKKKARGE